jgi:hypothetical protein
LKYLLVEPAVKAIAPNIALMKWARYCEINSIEFQYVRGCVRPDLVPDKILMSCVFTFYSDIYEKTIDYYSNMFPGVDVIVGGVFPSLYPEWFNKEKWSGDKFYGGSIVKVHKFTHPDIELLTPKFNVNIKSEDKLYSRNKLVLYSSRGCPNKCGYCAVPRLEGNMNSFKSIRNQLETGIKELPEATGVVLYDNNFTEHEYFDDICNELIEFGLPVDIHGLHLSAFNEHQAEVFSRMKWGGQGENSFPYLRFSFDHKRYLKYIERSLIWCKKYKVKARLFLYCLFNYNDSPDDFWWKVERCQEIVDRVGLTIVLYPAKYAPFDPNIKKQYIGEKWTKELVVGFTRMYTEYRNFIPITKQRTIYKNLIGSSKEEWISKCLEWYEKEDYISEGILTI